jgi:hypothetical protein
MDCPTRENVGHAQAQSSESSGEATCAHISEVQHDTLAWMSDVSDLLYKVFEATDCVLQVSD